MHKAASKLLFEKQTRFLGDLLRERGCQPVRIEFPDMEVLFSEEKRIPMRVRFRCDDWNELPPSIELMDKDGSLLASLPTHPGGVFNSSPHPATGRPFICMRGSREYHTHPSHVADLWEHLRGKSEYDLGGIITQVWRAWKNSRP